MEIANEMRDEQEKLWNGSGGRGWVEAQELLDHVFKPFEKLLAEAVAARMPGRVLDVGCGTGGTTVATARQLGAAGECTGIDVSEPMIAAARARTEREGTAATFIVANAQTHEFEPESFDMIVSRFGVMFFDDPVQAFANLRRAAQSGAELRLFVWRSAEENSFMTTAERAAAPLLPNLPARRSDEPGQFAFGDRHHVQSILARSGWADIDLRAIDVDCTLPEKWLVSYLTEVGPVGRALRALDAATRIRVIETARGAFHPFVHGAEVRFTAACWTITARA